MMSMKKMLVLASLAQMGAAQDIHIFHGNVQGNSVPFLARDSFAAPGHLGWTTSLPDSLVHNFPPHMLNNVYQTKIAHDLKLPTGATVQYHCNAPAVAGGTHCNVVVYFYECSPCATEKGGVSALLASSGYERTRCAPTFTTGAAGGIHHRMTGFVKTIPIGAVETITLTGELEFAMFAMSAGSGVQCSDSDGDANACEHPDLHDWCAFRGGNCQLNMCVQAGPSGGGCDLATCPHTELV